MTEVTFVFEHDYKQHTLRINISLDYTELMPGIGSLPAYSPQTIYSHKTDGLPGVHARAARVTKGLHVVHVKQRRKVYI